MTDFAKCIIVMFCFFECIVLVFSFEKNLYFTKFLFFSEVVSDGKVGSCWWS